MRPEFQTSMKRASIALVPILFSVLFIHATNTAEKEVNPHLLKNILEYTPWYVSLTDSSGLSKAALYAAYEGYSRAKNDSLLTNDSLISIIDFSKPSSEERLFLIDVKNQRLILKSLVAHGQQSGLIFAKRFSNRPSSHMSSLGLYKTSATYQGKHGYSMRLDGLEKGLNDKARERAIVMHGAHYVSQKYISKNGRIGRSFGCPAVPRELNATIIDLIKNGSCLYIYHPELNK